MAIFLSRPDWLIACGLLLIASAAVGAPSMELTGVALIALGASVELYRRCRAVALVAAQAVVYGGLYLLFVGSALHAAEGNASMMRCLDGVSSVGIMALQAPLLAGLLRADLR